MLLVGKLPPRNDDLPSAGRITLAAVNRHFYDEKAVVILAEDPHAQADDGTNVPSSKTWADYCADWAKRKGMGEEAIQHCRSYALEAERKMGEMLIAGEKSGEVATQTDGRPKKSVSTGNAYPVTAEDLGLSRRNQDG